MRTSKGRWLCGRVTGTRERDGHAKLLRIDIDYTITYRSSLEPCSASLTHHVSLLRRPRRITLAVRRLSSAFMRAGGDLCFRERIADLVLSRKQRGAVRLSGIGWISGLQRGTRGVSDCLTWMLKDDAC